jgi:hypothetical protein
MVQGGMSLLSTHKTLGERRVGRTLADHILAQPLRWASLPVPRAIFALIIGAIQRM